MPPTPQLAAADLTTMSPQQIVEAQAAGQLNQLLGIPLPADIPTEGQLTREHLAHMTAQQIVDAQQAGRLETLMNGQD